MAYSVQANGFTNVRLRNFCVGDHSGPGTLWRNFDKPNLFSLIRRDQRASCLSIQTITLDDLVSWENLDRVDYIKIDVEGAEQQVLDGAKRTIDKYRPIIQIEGSICDMPRGPEGYSALRASGSPNKVLIPKNHPKIEIPRHLGWVQVLD